MSKTFGRRGFIKAVGSAGLALSAWTLRLVPEVGGARSSFAAAAGPLATQNHPLSKFKPVHHVEPEGAEADSAVRNVLATADVRHLAASAGFDAAKLGPGKVSYETDANGRTLTVGAWIIDETHALIYAGADQRMEWFKSLSMVVTTDARIGQVKAYTLNGSVPAPVKSQSAEPKGAVAQVSEALGVSDAEAGYYGFCCGSYYNCCYDQWGNWHEYWQWTGSSPCGIDWQCAADICGVPCAAACVVPGWAPCVACILLVCGYASIRCTYWCNTCYYCYVT